MTQSSFSLLGVVRVAFQSEQLDSRIRVITPENIAFEYSLAGPFWRLPAYLIDLGIRIAVFAVISLTSVIVFGFAGLGSIGVMIALLTWLVMAWFYGGLFETFWNGQTPGKRIMQLRVISADGRPINAAQAILRNILRVVDAMPAFIGGAELMLPTYLAGLLAVSCTHRYQRLGDLACGTIVVIEERSRLRGVERIEGEAIEQVQSLLPASWAPSRSLSSALSKYVERRRFFGPARRAEIARHVGTVLIDQLKLPLETDHDALLCAAYHRSFLNETALETTLLETEVPESAVISPTANPQAESGSVSV